MNLIDILGMEEKNKEDQNRIYLYLTGNVCRAYEQSACLLKKLVPEAKISNDVFPHYEVILPAAHITLELIIEKMAGAHLMVRDSYIEILLDEPKKPLCD